MKNEIVALLFWLLVVVAVVATAAASGEAAAAGVVAVVVVRVPITEKDARPSHTGARKGERERKRVKIT